MTDLTEWTARQSTYLDAAFAAGDLERAYRLQLAAIVAHALECLRAEGVDVSDEPRARLVTLPLARHREVMALAEAHFSGAGNFSDNGLIAVEALGAALGVRELIEKQEPAPPNDLYQLIMAAASLGEAAARLTAQRGGYFTAAARHQRTTRQGSRNLDARRGAQTWWWSIGETLWRHLSKTEMSLSVKQRDNVIVQQLTEIADGRPVPSHSAVKRVRLERWRR